MKWFGKPYGAPYEADSPHAPTPTGEPCAWCDEPIEAHDAGMLIPHLGEGLRAWHYECNLRHIVGGVNHLRGTCTCYGGTAPDDPEMTRREAALAASIYWQALRITTARKTKS